MREVHAEHGVARLEQRQVDRHVGLRARVRLHVGVLGAEQRLGARDGGALDDVDELAAAVVALARIALGVLVGQHRAGGLEHGAADEVLRRDQLEAAVLPMPFVANGGGDSGSVSASVRQHGRGSWCCVAMFVSSGSPMCWLSAPRSSASRSDRCGADGGRLRTPCRATASGSRRPGRRRRCARPSRGRWRRCARATAARCRDRCRARRGRRRPCWRRSARPGRCRRARCRGRRAPSATARPTADADRRIVDRRFAVGAVIVDGVAEPCERLLEVFFQQRTPRDRRRSRSARSQIVQYASLRSAVSSQLSAKARIELRADS